MYVFQAVGGDPQMYVFQAVGGGPQMYVFQAVGGDPEMCVFQTVGGDPEMYVFQAVGGDPEMYVSLCFPHQVSATRCCPKRHDNSVQLLLKKKPVLLSACKSVSMQNHHMKLPQNLIMDNSSKPCRAISSFMQAGQLQRILSETL